MFKNRVFITVSGGLYQHIPEYNIPFSSVATSFSRHLKYPVHLIYLTVRATAERTKELEILAKVLLSNDNIWDVFSSSDAVSSFLRKFEAVGISAFTECTFTIMMWRCVGRRSAAPGKILKGRDTERTL